MQMKKICAGLLAAALLTASFAGCQNSGGSSTPAQGGDSQQTTSDKPYEGVKLNGIFTTSVWSQAISDHLNEFTEATGITMDMQLVTEEQVRQKIPISMAAGGADLDVVGFTPQQSGLQYYQNGWVTKLDDYVNNDPDFDISDFAEAALDTIRFDGGLYGIPYLSERQVLTINTEMFEKAGITEYPTTFDELEAAAAACDGIEPDVAGIVYRGKASASVTQLSGWLYGYGATFIEDGKAVFNSPEGAQAIWKYGNILYNYGPPGVVNMNWPETQTLYAQGMAAMRIDCDSNYAYSIDPENSLVADVTTMARFPGGPEGCHPFNVYAWAMGISSGSPNPDAAWEFISWAMSKEMDVKTMSAGNPTARNSTWENEEAAAAFPEEMLAVIEETIPVAYGIDRPIMINVEDARVEIGNAVLVAIGGGSVEDVQAAADKAAENVQKLLDEEAAAA